MTWGPAADVLNKIRTTQRDMERRALQVPRHENELRSEYFQRCARISEALAAKAGFTQWATLYLKRFWKFVQVAASRPPDAPDTKILNAKGALWRHTLGALSNSRKLQGHTGRWGMWRWDWWLDRFFSARYPTECWATAAAPDQPRWDELENEFIQFRLQGWERQPQSQHGGHARGLGASLQQTAATP